MSDTDLVMAPFDDDELRERIRSSTVTVDHARGADGLYRRTLGGGIYLLELLPAGTIVPELQTFDATAPVRYFTLEGKGLLRRRGELIESLVRNVGFVENANASKYFVGAWAANSSRGGQRGRGARDCGQARRRSRDASGAGRRGEL